MSLQALRKLFSLALLMGVLLLMAPVPNAIACGDDYCISQFNSCRELYCDGSYCQPCVDQYGGCKDSCPMPEGPSGH